MVTAKLNFWEDGESLFSVRLEDGAALPRQGETVYLGTLDGPYLVLDVTHDYGNVEEGGVIRGAETNIEVKEV